MSRSTSSASNHRRELSRVRLLSRIYLCFLWAFSTGIVGCSDSKPSHQDIRDGSTAKEDEAEPWSKETLTQIVPSSITYDIYGATLLAAVQYCMGAELEWAESVTQLDHLRLFEHSFGEYELLRGTDSNGLNWILAERPIAGTPWAAYFEGENIGLPRDPAMTPPLGFWENFERHSLIGIETSVPDPSEAGPGTAWADRWALCLVSASAAEAMPAEPEIDEASRLLGFLAKQFDDFSVRYAQRGAPWQAAPTLDALAEAYGGLNETAWVNPYSGNAMQQVALEAATPGDYTLMESEDGVRIGFHFLDTAGGVDTCIVGFQGTYQPAVLDES